MHSILNIRGGICPKTEFDIWGRCEGWTEGTGKRVQMKLSGRDKSGEAEHQFASSLREGPPESSVLRAV